MKKHLFIYFTHRWNDDIRQRYAEVTESLKKCDDTDVLFMYADIIQEEVENDPIIKEKKMMYYNNDIYNHFNKTKITYPIIDPFCAFKKVYLNNIEFFNNYDDMYIWEYDQWYAGDLGEYINMLNKEEADLIASYIEILYKDKIKWLHQQYYYWCIKNGYYEDQFDDNILKSCLSFARISIKYLNMMFSEKYDKLTDIFLYELYVPTIIYNNGGIIKSLSTEYTDKIFYYREDLNTKIFSCEGYYTSKEEMIKLQQNYDHPMLYTRWK